MRSARPTLRCLRDDLKLTVPPADEPLDEVDHPLLRKAREQFANVGAPHERIASIDDTVLFKVKVQRWRGAVWTEDRLAWVVAAGWREAGGTDDFYAVLAAEGRAARAKHNAEHKRPLTADTYTGYLIPDEEDRSRYRVEAGVRFIRQLEQLVPDLVRRSLRDGHEHDAELPTFGLGVQVRADHGHETYVAVRITGSVPANLVPIVLEIVPGCDRAGWYPEPAMPDRRLGPNEQVWSNLMDTSAAASLLEVD